MRLLGIDYGQKFWGLAWADELGVAYPLGTILDSTPAARWDALTEIVRKRMPDCLVVGYPLHMDGREGKRTAEVDAFILQLEKRFGLPVHKADERLTTRQVEAGLSSKAIKQRKQKGQTDALAASLFLSDFLQLSSGFPTIGEDEAVVD